MPLEKARLMEIEADQSARVVPGSEIPVQFNPQSLKLSLVNKLDAQESSEQTTRQSLGKSTTLAFDLHFDTSDEGTTDAPVSVRLRTAAIERFVMPRTDGKRKQRAPKARFVWQDLQIDGIIEDLSIDFTLFASNGTPLRAKMSVSMREQDPRYQYLEAGAGANTAAGSRPPGTSSAGPGSFGASFGASASVGIGVSGSLGLGAALSVGGSVSGGIALTDSTRVALAGESAADFAARNGLDPAAWRGVAAGLDSTLSLKGGAEVDFNASISAASGVGVTVGVESGASSSVEAAFGLDGDGSVATPAGLALGGGAAASAGFALAAGGGVAAAIAAVSTVKADSASAATREAFGGATTMAAAATPAPPEQSRTPLALTGLPSATAQAEAAPAPSPPRADTRATTFGFGVPLRPLITGAADERRGTLVGSIPLRPHDRAADRLAPTTDPTAAPWTHLPADRVQRAADAAQQRRRPARPCGCAGPCAHGAAR
jgi:hypothetical protein